MGQMGVIDDALRRKPASEQPSDRAVLLRESAARAPIEHDDAARVAVEAQNQRALVLLWALSREAAQQAVLLRLSIATGNGRMLERAVAGVEEERSAGVGTNGLAQLGHDLVEA